MAQRGRGAARKASKKSAKELAAARAPDMDSLGFQAMDSNVPGLSHVILQKLNMKSYEDYKSAMDGKKKGSDFGIRTYFDMFQKMEDTFKFCAECKKLPDALPDPKSLRRCKRCQNVYYCSVACQRANWPVHKKFCKKLKLVALDRLVEWLIFTVLWLSPGPGAWQGTGPFLAKGAQSFLPAALQQDGVCDTE
uniref:MYND-type domain-containing protein n=1 Tax=Phasianus colchicus TaxID=9054 RepID=A0A669PL30_PHACC